MKIKKTGCCKGMAVIMLILFLPGCTRDKESAVIYDSRLETTKEEIQKTGTETTKEEVPKEGTDTQTGEKTARPENGNSPEDISLMHEEKKLYVQVGGAVKAPGVYPVKEGTRVFEAVELAGGLTQEACADKVNLARTVSDAMVIYIPAKSEENSDEKALPSVFSEGDTVPDNRVERININTADKETLMTLPGIGASRADAIIRYRETNGSFQTTEEIMKVNGIKQAAFDKLKDRITV